MSPSRRSSGLVLEDRGSIVAAPTELVDRSRFRNDGTYSNMNTAVQLPSELYIHSFNGTNSWIDIPAAPVLTPLGDFSVEIWLQSNDDSGQANLINNYSWATMGWQMKVEQGTPSFGTFDGARTQVQGAWQMWKDDELWHHLIAVCIVGSNGLLYGNGLNIVDSADSMDACVISTNSTRLGASVTGADPFSGYLALSHVYNYALNAGQVEKRFASTRWWFGV